MATNDGGPAFPRTRLGRVENFLDGSEQDGMTLRAYLAGQAMQGDWASQSEEMGEFSASMSDGEYQQRAIEYCKAADALIAALEAERG